MKVELEFTKDTLEELTRLRDLTGFTEAEVIGKAFNLLRAYLLAKQKNTEWVVLPRDTSEIECLNELCRVIIPGLKEC